jgi:hypothetical protein
MLIKRRLFKEGFFVLSAAYIKKHGHETFSEHKKTFIQIAVMIVYKIIKISL